MPTVDRVLPWRRHHETAAVTELAPLLASYRRRHPKAPVAVINRAYQMAAEAHRMINNPDASLDLIIARLEAERKAAARGSAIPPAPRRQ